MTLPAAYFDAMYEQSPDPWSFETRWYEQRKYAVTMAALPKPRFHNGFEPGCSIGVLTEQLADRCDSLLSTDISPAAVDAASRRVAALANVTVEQRALLAEWPPGSFDLVVVSEIGYYLDRDDLNVLINRLRQSLTADGVVVAVHWRHPVADYPLRGDDVHEALRATSELTSLVTHREDDFVLDVLGGPDARSVAAETGLLT